MERRHRVGTWLTLPLLLLLGTFRCCPGAWAARRVVLVLRPELTAAAVFGPNAPIAALLRRAAIGVMNTAVRGAPEPASEYLTLGAGERLAAGPLARPARFPEERVEGDPAAAVYVRRLGPLARPYPRLIYPDWAAYRNTPHPDYLPAEQAAAGGLGEALRSRGGAAWLGVGDAARTRLGALLAVDGAGTVPWGEAIATVAAPPESGVRLGTAASTLSSQRRAPDAEPQVVEEIGSLSAQRSLVIVDLPVSFGVAPLARLLVDLASDPRRDVLLVSPYPPPGRGGTWDRLPPLLGIGPGFRAGLLTSATTRTPGLVANLDVAPTLLALLGVPLPRTMSGRPMRSEPVAGDAGTGAENAAVLLRFARGAALSGRAIIPIGIAIEASAVLVLALVVLALRARSRSAPFWARLASGSMLLVAALPLGLLLGPVTEPKSIAGLGLAVGGWTISAALAAGLVSHLGRSVTARAARATALSDPKGPSALLCLAGLTVIVVAGDLLLGGRLIARSPLSGFPVSGIRFYGVGNEYMGVLVGMGIAAPLAFETRLARFRWAQAALFLALLLLISSPRYGANFGGAMAGAAGFGTTLMLSVWPRRPLRVLFLAVGALLLAGAGALTWDALRPAATRSHIGDFAQAVRYGGWAAAAPVLRRKAAMDLRILTSGFALIPIAGVAPLVGVWYRDAGLWLSEMLARRPELRAATGGALVGAWTGLFLKDSGVTPLMFILGSLLAVLLDEQFRARGKGIAGGAVEPIDG